MTVRAISRRIFESLWRGVYSREVPRLKNTVRGYRIIDIESSVTKPQVIREGCEGRWARQERRRSAAQHPPPTKVAEGVGRYNTFASVRRTLIDNVLRRVTNTQAANLRRKAAHYLTSQGNPAPFLALVGVSLASGSGIITKEDEIEGVCYEIRQAVSRTSLLSTELNIKEAEKQEEHSWSLNDFQLGKAIAKGCSAVVYSARVTKQMEEGEADDYPLAIKMMFNYHAESNALIILRAMQRETVAARSVSLPEELTSAAAGCIGEMVRVPPHPNIVEIITVFADKVPGLPGDRQLYGDALPERLNPGGCGRNMSLFLVMRRYDCSLREYLEQYREEVTSRISIVLLTQLLEGVAFLHRSGVAHRDLKSDNILIDLSGGPGFPRLVITDFGCCLADKNHGFRVPYRTYDTDKGGNAALMAPEVMLATPGAFSYINYNKSDLWTAGTIAYEIFGGENPFYSSETQRGLQSSTYKMEELPSLPPTAPPLLDRLVHALLQRDPHSRPPPRQAAAVCQLFLWSPSMWIKERKRVSSQDILQWLLTMTTKVLCESRWGNSQSALQEYQLVATFLATMSMQDIRTSLDWIQDQLEEEEE